MTTDGPCSLDVLALRIADLRPTLRTRAVVLTGSMDDAEDLVQDTCERALRSARLFETDRNLAGWLNRIMSNLFVDGWRQRKRFVRLDDTDFEPAAPEVAPVPWWTALEIEDIASATAGLPPIARTVFELHERDGLPYQEIARRLGVPVATVGTRIMRARARLRTLLAARAFDRKPRAPATVTPLPFEARA